MDMCPSETVESLGLIRIKTPFAPCAIFSDWDLTDGTLLPAPISTIANLLFLLHTCETHSFRRARWAAVRSRIQCLSLNIRIFGRASAPQWGHVGNGSLATNCSSSIDISS